MPAGKLAGACCTRLDGENQCRVLGCAERPAVCNSLMPESEMYGRSRDKTIVWLRRLERKTQPIEITMAG